MSMLIDKQKKIVILDIEGNSASKKNELKITQFSALILKDNQIEEINFYNRNVNLIPPIVQKLTRISINKLKTSGLSERHLIKEIYNILLDADIIYAYGYAFDKQIIKSMLKKYEYPPLLVKWIDPPTKAKEKLQRPHIKLSILSKELGFSKEDFHNALTDCYAILHIIQYLDNQELIQV